MKSIHTEITRIIQNTEELSGEAQSGASKKLLLIDGNFLLFRMFYGIQSPIRSTTGVRLNAALGFVGAVLRYIKTFKPTHLAVVFDGEHASFRTTLSCDYKANRTEDYSVLPDDESPFAQLPIIYDTLNYLKLKHSESELGYEGDDLLASYAANYPDYEKIIVSGDVDMLQLVDEKTVVFMDRGKKSVTYDIAAVKNRYGVFPHNIIDYKCLVGDASDNISGVSGIGPKTAANLIEKYGGIGNVIDSTDSITPSALKEKIQTNIDKLNKNYALISLNALTNLPFSTDELKIDFESFSALSAITVLRKTNYIS